MNKLLLDRPAKRPGLDFDRYAATLAGIIEENDPNFAIGVYGSWGTGKTTLMELVKEKLNSKTSIAADFNAWRYEREEHLIIPLLDTIRQALVVWSGDNNTSKTRKIAEKAWKTAVALGEVIASLGAGVTAEAGLPLVGKIGWNADTAMKKAREFAADHAESRKALEPQSLYFACFQALQQAFADFLGDGATRIVIFIDDLDRCLPETALEVLESMKLFFNQHGFVFVVGLDRAVIELAVESSYREFNQYAKDMERTQRISGERYIEKMFQIPFSLPPVPAGSLESLLDAMMNETAMEEAEKEALRQTVHPHLDFLFREREVNPREIKRYVNLFLLQRQILDNPGQPANDDIILALQTLAFRPDWRKVNQAFRNQPKDYLVVIQNELDNNPQAVKILDENLEPSPELLLSYLATEAPGRALLEDTGSLDRYLAISQAFESTESSLRSLRNQALDSLIKTRTKLKAFSPTDSASPVSSESLRNLGQVESVLKDFRGREAEAAQRNLGHLHDHLTSGPASEDGDARATWRDEALDHLRGLTQSVVALR